MVSSKQTPFAGLVAGDGTDMPEWYSDKIGLSTGAVRELPALRGVVGREDNEGDLAGVTGVQAGYKDPESGEWVPVGDKQAVVNPEWLGEGLEETNRGHALWQFASDRYTPVPPEAMYGPLIDVARRMDLSVFGFIEEYRHGGEVHVDLLLPDFRFDVGKDTYILNYTSGYSHFGDQSLYYEVGAVNERTGAEYRSLTDKESCPHRGDARDKVSAWWETAFNNAESATSTLGSVMREAMRYVVPLKGDPEDPESTPMPYNLTGFFEGLGWPESLAEAAASHVKDANDLPGEPEEATALALYEGMAAALTEDFGGKTGGYQIRRHNRKANKVLFSPPSAEATVINYWQTELAEQETLTMDERAAKQALGERYGDTQAAIEHYEDTKSQLKEILDEATTDAETDGGVSA